MFFGEGLPTNFWRFLLNMWRTDCLLVMGTTLAVEPFASLARLIGWRSPRVLINREAVGSFCTSEPRRARARDTLVLGDLQLGVRAFIEALGWGADLERLARAAHWLARRTCWSNGRWINKTFYHRASSRINLRRILASATSNDNRASN